MKNYMVTHTFKSKEAKAKMGEVVASMKMEDSRMRNHRSRVIVGVFSIILYALLSQAGLACEADSVINGLGHERVSFWC